MTSLDRKLASILAGAYSPADFVIADAKDADMASAITKSAGEYVPARIEASLRSSEIGRAHV